MGPCSGEGPSPEDSAPEEACKHSWRQLCDQRGPIVQGPTLRDYPTRRDREAKIYRAVFFCTRCLETETRIVEGRLYYRATGALADPTGQELYAEAGG
jgi:hypothetical protein